MRAVGIDLGTTNSAVAAYDAARGEARMLPAEGGRTWTPSVIGLRRADGKEKQLVGEVAVNWAARAPRDTIFSVKRLMGRHFDDEVVAKARERLNYRIVRGPQDDPRAHVELGDETCTPAQLSALLLRQLAANASRSLGEEVTHAVITVPAYFLDAQRAATREAAERAGLHVKKIIDEPTAAAVAFFGLDKNPGDRSRILVYDLGGGTFDISVLNAVKDAEGHGQFHILQYSGDNWLGGDDFDLAIVEYIIASMKREHGVDPSHDKGFLMTAKAKAEQAKRTLNEDTVAYIVIPAAHRTGEGRPLDVELVLTREQFDEMIEPMVRRTMELVERTLEEQDLTPDDISDVLLVGGATYTRKVYETVESHFGREKVRRNINPMECVGLGAGILAGTLHGVECPEPACRRPNDDAASRCTECGASLVNAPVFGETGLNEVTGPSMGIAAVRGNRRDVFVPIIPRNTPYPLPEPQQRSFEATDSRFIRVPVYEGDDPVASRNAEQGVIEFELPEEIDPHSRVDVSFNYTVNRTINVRISVAGTDMVKEDTPRRQLPPTPAPEPTQETDNGWNEQLLSYVMGHTEEFLQSYEAHIEPNQRMKVNRDLEQAQRALDHGETGEYERLTGLLYDDMLHQCGLASKFAQAERAAEGASPELTGLINEAVRLVKEAHARGNPEQLSQQERNLTTLVARALTEANVAEVPTEEGFGGELRIPDHRLDT
ncbi:MULTISPECIES: Hsp70 family protein [Streptomyces]|uniref:Hsp70 family protein n=1 Tax=Streptomyces TaxID=1883 RepID=UPI0004CB75B8|nr:Hsp70 family protein [Streptomyces sp. NRRL F-5053]